MAAEQVNERERQNAAAQAAEQQRAADEVRAKEIVRLAAERRVKEQERLAQEIKVRDERQRVVLAQAKQREGELEQERVVAQQAQAARDRERSAELARVAELELLVAKANATLPVAKLTPSQARDQALKSASADWETVKSSIDPEVLYTFLAKHTGGTELSEMAYYRLDQLSKPRVFPMVAKGHDASLGYRGPRFKLGDEFQFELVNTLTQQVQRRYVRKVTAVDQDLVQLNDSAIAYTPLGATLADDYGSYAPAFAGQPAEFQIGKKWSSRTTQRARDGLRYELNMDSKVVAVETITVPAGTFQTYVVEAVQYVSGGSYQNRKLWYDPRYGVPIRSEVIQYSSERHIERSERRELIALKADRS